MIYWKDDKHFGVDCMRCTHTFTIELEVPSAKELCCPKCGTNHVFRQQKNNALKLRIGKLKKIKIKRRNKMRTKIVYGLNEVKLRKVLELMQQEVEELIQSMKSDPEVAASLERGDLLVVITEDAIAPAPTFPEEKITLGMNIGYAVDRELEQGHKMPEVVMAEKFIQGLISLHVGNMIREKLSQDEIKDKVMN